MCRSSYLKKNQLHIACWNINGFTSKGFNKYSDLDFMKEIASKDIVCLLETYCPLDKCLNIKGFKSVHLIRPKNKKVNKHSGGLSVFIKDFLRPGIKFLEHKTSDYIWLKLDKVFFGLIEDIYLCFIYDPPEGSSYSHTLEENILDLIENDIVKYSNLGHIILAGDINARTGSGTHDFIQFDQNTDHMTSIFDNFVPDIDIDVRFSMDKTLLQRGKLLNDICVQSGLRILNGRTVGDLSGTFTCHTPKGSSVVDYFIVSESLLKDILFFSVHKFLPDLSDHCQISTMLNVNCEIYRPLSSEHISIPPIYKWDEQSPKLFQSALSSEKIQNKIKLFNSAEYKVNTDDLINDFNDIICEAADLSLKKIFRTKLGNNCQVKKNKVNQKWWDVSLEKLKKQLYEKEKLFYKYNRDPKVRGAFFSHLKLFRKTRKKKIRNYRTSIIEKLDNLYDDNPSAYWKLLRDISNKTENTSSSDEHISSKEWLDYFKNLNTKPINPQKDLKISELLTRVEGEKIFTELDNKISEKEISKAICSLKNKKSSGFDSILNEMLKNSQIFLSDSLKKLFNDILLSGNYPKIWAKGFIVPIFKSGEKDDPSNYRGITITSCLGKLFTKVLNSRLENFYENRNIICKEQIGFCKGKRTADHMFVLKTLIDKYTQSSHKKLYTCFVDFRRAFDTVHLDSLFYKLRTNGVSDIFYNILKDMYSKTELHVKLNKDILTNPFYSNIGVRQGDNLSPNLFKLFINDLPGMFDASCSPVILNSNKINCILYADDVVLISETASGLQNCLSKLSTFCDEWGLEVNIKKTKSLVFNKSGRLDNTNFTYRDLSIEKCRNYKYLGVLFSISGNFTEAKEDLYKRGLKAFFKFKSSFKDNLPKLKTLFHIFDHTVKPVLLYGSELWGVFQASKLVSHTDQYFYKMCKDLSVEKLHIKFCKYSIGVNKRSTNLAVMAEVGRYPLLLDIIVRMFKYYIHISKSENSLLADAFVESKELFSQNKHCWYACMHVLAQYFNLKIENITKSKINLKKYILNRLKPKYNELWKKDIFDDNRNTSQGNKLRTYRLFKNNFIGCIEPYLSISSPRERNLLTKFRISAHKLEIETGRYQGIKAENRICKLCKKEVEDEIHFLLKCEVLQQDREKILSNIENKYQNLKNIDHQSKFIWLMSCEDTNVIKQLGSLLCILSDSKNNLSSNKV